MGVAEDGVEGRAQLVAEGGEEIILHGAGALGFDAGAAFAFEQFAFLGLDAFEIGHVAGDSWKRR